MAQRTSSTPSRPRPARPPLPHQIRSHLARRTATTGTEVQPKRRRQRRPPHRHAYRTAGWVYARADHLPQADTRVTERLCRRPIVLAASNLQALAGTLTAAEAASTALGQPSLAPDLGIGDYPIISAEPLPVPRGAWIDPPSL